MPVPHLGEEASRGGVAQPERRSERHRRYLESFPTETTRVGRSDLLAGVTDRQPPHFEDVRYHVLVWLVRIVLVDERRLVEVDELVHGGSRVVQ